MFQMSMKPSRIPISAWNLMGDTTQMEKLFLSLA